MLFFFFFWPPLPTSRPVCSSCLSVSAWDLCWMRESAFVLSAPHFKALCLCRLMRKQGGLLQTSQWEAAGLLLPDGGWTTAHRVFREPSSSLVRQILLRYCLWCIEVFSPCSTLLLLWMLCSHALQHLRFFVLEINSNVDVTGTQARWAAENRCVVTAVTVTDSEVERTVQSLTEIGADCSASGGGF